MNTVVGAIEDVQVKPGVSKTSGKPYTIYTVLMGGNKYSTFNKPEFKVGDVVSITYERDGMYANIKEMVLAGTAEKVLSSTSFANSAITSKDKIIVRQSCNQRAIEFMRLLFDTQPENFKAMTLDKGVLKIVDEVSQHFENRVWRE